MRETLGRSIENWLHKHHWNPILTFFSFVFGIFAIGLVVGYGMTNKHVYAASFLFFISFVLLLGGGWHAWKASHRLKWICTVIATVAFVVVDYFWVNSMNQPVPWLLLYIDSHLPWVLVIVLGLLLLSVLVKRPREAGSEPCDIPSANNNYALPAKRPIIVPTKYGEIKSGPEAGHSGISVRNDGEPAYTISAHSVTLAGIGTIHMGSTAQHLKQGEPELSFPSWRSGKESTLGNGLYYFMVENKLDRITIPVTYRDADLNWYQTDVILIKNQMARSVEGSESGIQIDWRQKPIPEPKPSDSTTPPTLTDRAFALCREMKEYMERLGPMEYDTGQNAMTNAEMFKDVNKDVILRCQKLDSGYYRRFAQRFADIYNEFGEEGMVDRELEQLASRSPMDDPEIFSGIIERLRRMAAEYILRQQQ